ncbi:hypothetical protein EmuJ_000095150 [Echinococcus multilocularis]|uniref:Tyrosine-protein kinase ephrin type A/B receptor-like domain-containing protein n=1 Tax=Echinococcus multilocularis TaxID=6211 RepID=A0A087VYJ4_ECHMU|nr:hypothetical protein EmuJ_000095150 [Echinococcus multilocularis]
MLFVCVLQEPPDPKTRRGTSFYEIHEIHIPHEEINAPHDTTYLVEVTFETTGLDPFPPGCSHVFGQGDREMKACYENLNRRVHLPELHNNNSGIFIHEMTAGEELQQLPYLQQTLLSGARLFCAKHHCQVNIVRNILYRNGTSIVLDGCGKVLNSETINEGRKEESEPWRDEMGDTVENPFLHMYQWMPTLQFEFTHPSLSCGKLANLFDVVITKNDETNLPYPRAWKKNTELYYLSSLLSTSLWRKQDKPHQVYFAPVFCTRSTTETSRVQGRLPSRPPIYPFRGLTFMWSVHRRKSFTPEKSSPKLRMRDFQVTVNSAEMSFVHMIIKCGNTNCTLSMEVRLNTVLAHSVYILPSRMLLNKSSSSFALILDGPEFSLHTGTFDRRLRLFQDGRLIVLGTYSLPQMQQPLEAFVQATEFSAFASTLIETRSAKFNIIVRFYNWPVYDLSSGSVSRTQLAWSMIPQPCRKTALLPPFHPPPSVDPSKIPSVLVHFPNDTKRFFYSADFRLCQSVCAEAYIVAPHADSNPQQYVCLIGKKPVPCDPRMSIPQTIDANAQLTNGPGKEVILSSKCLFSTFIFLYAQTWKVYDSKKLVLSCNGNIHAQEKWSNRINLQRFGNLLCQEDSLLFLMSPTCRVKVAERETGVDLIQLYVYPVFQGCHESVVESIGANEPRSHSRVCSPGYFLSKVPPHKCEPCPEDTFSDPDTASEECLPCPDVRNTTQHLPARSSIHCTNPQLDRERERLALKAVNLVPSLLQGLAKNEANFDDDKTDITLTEKEVLQHLAPDPLKLREQETAESLFKEITHLTFSIEEIVSMILVALALAMMGAVVTFILGIGSRRTIYAFRRRTIVNRLLKWINQHLRGLYHRVWFARRCCRRRHDSRPSWQKRKSAAIRTGNIYQIKSAKEEEEEVKFYEELQTSLVNLITCEERPIRQDDKSKKEVTRMSVYDEVAPAILTKGKNEPDVPDYTFLEIAQSNLKHRNREEAKW